MADESGSSAFKFIVEAIDRATRPVKELAALVQQVAGVEHAAHQKGAQGAAEHSRAFMALSGHVSVLKGHFGHLSASIGEFGNSISEFMPMLAGLGAAGSLVGLFETVEHASESFAELNKQAKEAGVTAQQFSELAMAAKLTDVPMETMSTGLFRLNRAIADSAAGKNKDATALFKQLGINLRDANGHLRDSADLMPQLADAFAHTTDPAMKARMAMALFGRSGKDMIPLLSEGRAAIDEYAKAAREVQFVPQGEEATKLEEFHKSWLLLTSAVEGFTMEIGTKLAPVLQPIIDAVKNWIVANRDWVATGIAAAVGELATAISHIDIQAVMTEVRAWITQIGEVTSWLGGWHTAIGAVVLVLGSPLIAAVGAVITVFGQFAGVLKGLAMVVWANPILAAVGAVALAAYEIYEHWGAVKEFFENLWHGIVASFEWAMAKIQPIVDFVKNAAKDITNGWVGRQLGLDDKRAEEIATNKKAAAAAGPGNEPVFDPTTGALMPTLPPSPYAPGSLAGAVAAQNGVAGAPGANGKVEVTVNLKNAPPGTQVTTSSAGDARASDVNVGYANALAYPGL